MIHLKQEPFLQRTQPTNKDIIIISITFIQFSADLKHYRLFMSCQSKWTILRNVKSYLNKTNSFEFESFRTKTCQFYVFFYYSFLKVNNYSQVNFKCYWLFKVVQSFTQSVSPMLSINLWTKQYWKRHIYSKKEKKVKHTYSVSCSHLTVDSKRLWKPCLLPSWELSKIWLCVSERNT